MASLIPGYNYDIFISYRQKDNKHDGWVTEFVDNLKGELESTFKEELSVYFDINPHDGLLETHDVDASLKEKLKCLIFIPIISRTYCDPKSFAWEHEFKAFVEQASKDQYGLKVKLPNGNVASRVLPVIIHDLDPSDIEEYESVLGGVLRGIEFIYKEAGIDKPLAPGDNEKKNLNNTTYRIQIIKVAHATREIILGMQAGATQIMKEKDQPEESFKEIEFIESKIEKNMSERASSRKWIIITAVVALLTLAAILAYSIIFKDTVSRKSKTAHENSIAVLPFRNDSPDSENQHFVDGTMEAILNNLCKVSNLKVISRTSVENYRNQTKTISEIARELKVGFILEGSGQKYDDNIRLTVQLIDAGNDKHIWSSLYDRNIRDIFKLQSEIAESIVSEIKVFITADEKELIEKIPTSSLAAYDIYLKANNLKEKYTKTHDLSSYQAAVNLYLAALEIDTAFARAYTGLADIFSDRYYFETYFNESFLDSCLILADIALSFDAQLDEAYYLKGEYYFENGNFGEALINYDNALKINLNYSQAYNRKGRILTWQLADFVKGIDNYHSALNLIHGNERPALIKLLARAYLDVGFVGQARSSYYDAYSIDGNKLSYYSALSWLEFSDGNIEEALKLRRMCYEIDTTYMGDLFMYSLIPGKENEAYFQARRLLYRYKKSGALNLQQTHRIGYAFWQVGKQKEAEEYFSQQIRISEELIKLERPIAQRRAAHYDLAATYAFLGDKEKAYKYLNEFSKMNFYQLWWISLIKHDPLFNSIRNEEQFQKIIRNMEAKHNAEHERVRKWLEEEGMEQD